MNSDDDEKNVVIRDLQYEGETLRRKVEPKKEEKVENKQEEKRQHHQRYYYQI